MNAERLGLSDREFWDDPERTFDEVDERLSERGFLGLLLDAPSSVPLTHNETFPAALYHNTTFASSREASVKESAVITAMDLLSGRAYAGMVVPRREDWAPPVIDDADDDEEPPEGTTSALYVMELRRALHLPWKQADLLVTVLLRGERSNRVRVSLGAHPQDYRDEAVEAFLSAERMKTGPVDVRPPRGEPYPHYDPLPASPPLPEGTGIAMTVDRVVVLHEGARCVLHGAWRLPLLPQELVVADTSASAGLAETGGRRPTAIKRIPLVASGSVRADPVVVTLQVPSFDPVSRDDVAPVATGHFAIDLVPLLPGGSQTYFIHAFAGEVMEGPVLTAFVTEDRVPPGLS